MSMNDPSRMNDPRTRPDFDTRGNSSMIWIAGGLALALVLGLVYWGASDSPRTAGTNPPVTTGQGKPSPTAPTPPAPPSPAR
jgi:hypothetical protein